MSARQLIPPHLRNNPLDPGVSAERGDASDLGEEIVPGDASRIDDGLIVVEQPMREEALIEMYLAGIFVRRVEDITEALRGTRVSPSTVSDLNKKIYATIEAREKAQRVGAKLREQHMSKAAELVEGGVRETLAYYAFPEEHWRRIRTNNPLERILREIRRRTRVVGAFPNGQSALNLAAARLRHVAGTEWSTKRYLSMDFLKDHQTTRTTA